MPLLLNHSNDFYNLTSLTNQEISFMKKLESFDDKNNNPFTINMTRMNNVFKIADYLQIKRCFDIHTFASISQTCYDNVDELKSIKVTMDPMIKTLTRNNDSTCLSRTRPELIFYKPFLTLPRSKWSDDQNVTFHWVQTMTAGITFTGAYFKALYFDARRGT